MIFNRYKDRDWDATYNNSAERLRSMLEIDAPKVMVRTEARTLLTAAYGGPWRAIKAMIIAQFNSAWRHYCWLTWERIRIKVLRRPQDEATAAYERVREEDEAMDQLAEQLDDEWNQWRKRDE